MSVNRQIIVNYPRIEPENNEDYVRFVQEIGNPTNILEFQNNSYDIITTPWDKNSFKMTVIDRDGSILNEQTTYELGTSNRLLRNLSRITSNKRKDLQGHDSFPTSIGGNISYYDKYIKYKNKYTQLKNSLKN